MGGMSARDGEKSSRNGRISVATAMQICFEECQFDDEARRLWRKGEPVHLTPKAFELLRLLIESRPRLEGRQMVMMIAPKKK